MVAGWKRRVGLPRVGAETLSGVRACRFLSPEYTKRLNSNETTIDPTLSILNKTIGEVNGIAAILMTSNFRGEGASREKFCQ
jgi:hypothetical protein